MTWHLLKLVWNRKRTTLLVMIEIAAAFLVLFAVAAFATYVFDNWRRPVGFTWDRVWDIEIDQRSAKARNESTVTTGGPDGAPASGASPSPAAPDPVLVRMQQVMLAVRDFSEVEAIAAAGVTPFEMGGMDESRSINGRRIEFGANEVTDDYAALLGLRLTRGRWLGPSDTGQSYDAVVINQDFATHLFGNADPIGRPIVELDADDLARGARVTRIVGVVEAYREDGEFDSHRYFALYRKTLDGTNRRDRAPRHLLVRLRPGTNAEFEERLVRTLQAVAPTWSFEVRKLADLHDTQRRFTLLPLAAVGTVAVSLLIMVGLGLLGVLWQSVTQRTREIGVRRAKGAWAGAIARQILGEIGIMTTLALVPAVAIALQVPLLGPFYWVQPHVYGLALAISLTAIYVLAGLCAWYPARLASSVQPADALRYE